MSDPVTLSAVPDFLVFLRTFPLGLGGTVTVSVTGRQACECVCLLSVCPQVCTGYPEWRHHATHERAKKACPLCPRSFSIASAGHCSRCYVCKDLKTPKSRKGPCFWKCQSTRDIFVFFPQRLLWKSSLGSSLSALFHLKLPSQIYVYISNASLELLF